MELPVNITANKIKLLRDHINANFNAFDDKDNLDLDKCQRNVAYSAGNIYTNYNGLLMQEEQKLAAIKEDLSTIKAIAYDEKTGIVYVGDAYNHRIRKIALEEFND